MNGKSELRKKAKEIRKGLDTERISVQLCCKIRENEIYKASNDVMLFYPKAEELDFRALLSDDKNFYLPRVSGDKLEVCPYRIGDNLKKSEFGVLEPLSDNVDAKILDLVIVPALMADKKGYRLGYGGGFYDRFLRVNEVKTICALPTELTVDNLPHNEYDVKIDYIIST